MKYYIINSDGKEVSFDLSFLGSKSGVSQIRVTDGSKSEQQYYVRRLAGKPFISEDQKSWSKLSRLKKSNQLTHVNEIVKLYRGYKPSGLSSANAGDLVTEMPGKVVKLLTAEGAVVQASDTLLILEAMKMENEIKAGIDGVVKSVHVQEGQTLDSGHLMIEIEQ